jgi:hypothetical protein
MTQSPYQPPYPPPPGGNYPTGFDYYQPPQSDPLTPARRASTTMYVVGGLMLLGAMCFGGIVALLPELMQNPQFSKAMSQTPGATPEMIKMALIGATVIAAIVGVATIVLAAFVRRGGLGSIITSMVLATLVALFLARELAGMFVRGRQLPQAELCLTSCMFIVPLALLLVLLVFLIQAAKSAGRVKAIREQYTQQYWQYAYQQQAYQQQAQNPVHHPPPLQPPTRPESPIYPPPSPPPPPERGGPSDPTV